MNRADFRQHLLDIAAVSQQVAGRVYPVHLPQAVQYPAITYQQITGTSEQHLQGRSALRFVRMQVDVWAEDVLDAEAISQALDGALDGYRGPVGIYEATDSWRTAQQDIYEHDVDVYRITTDYSIYYRQL